MRISPISWAILGIAVVLSGCGSSTPEEAAAEAPSTDVAREPRWSEVLAPTDLSLLEAPAYVVPAPGSEARVAPSHEARVVRVHVRAGDVVEAGAPIVDVVMPAVLEAAARWASVTPRRSLRAQRRTELAALQQEGLVDRERVFEQETEIATLDAERAQALATLRAASLSPSDSAQVLRRGTITLTAPIGGTVRAISAAIGEVRAPDGEPFATLVALTPARIEARLAQPLPPGATLEFVGLDGSRTTLDAASLRDTVDPLDGLRVAWIDPVADAAPLVAGLHGRVVAHLVSEGIVELDGEALVLEGARVFVERRSDAGAPERVEVQVLTASATRAIVRGPLAVGDRVSLEPSRTVEGAE
ncbi:MAG: efflux RND transporter periplasmic adaptor subunit [Sandaracinus sp.]